MGGKTAIAAGLLVGVLTGAGALAAVLYLAPDLTMPAPSQATPSPQASRSPAPPGSGAPTTSPSTVLPSMPGVSPSASPGASASPGGAGSPSASDAPGASTTGLLGVGEPAPALVVPQLGGGTIHLAALRGQPVWVNFMATWCLPCRDELPLMAGFAVRYQEQGLVVLAIDVREDDAAVQAFMSGLGITLSTGLDHDGTAQAAWSALAIPVHFWVDGDGIVRDGALGSIGSDIMARGLTSIMPGVDVTP